MKVKTTFPNGIYMKIITWHNLKVLSWKEKKMKGMSPVEIFYELEQVSKQWHIKLKGQLEILG
jgi:hypothetical protein